LANGLEQLPPVLDQTERYFLSEKQPLASNAFI